MPSVGEITGHDCRLSGCKRLHQVAADSCTVDCLDLLGAVLRNDRDWGGGLAGPRADVGAHLEFQHWES